MKKICVIGSINVDLVTKADRYPKPGETIIGKDFNTFPGGKGANQAAAAGRLGADVCMIGKVGDDEFGVQMIETLKNSGVDTVGIDIMKDTRTGVACIQVVDSGQNSIVIYQGANAGVTEEFIMSKKDLIDKSDIIMIQLEIPMSTVVAVVKYAKRKGKVIVFDPAPVQKINEELYSYIDIITPNETEIQTLTGLQVLSEEEVITASRSLIDKGVNAVIHKAGKKGAYLVGINKFERFPTYDVKVIDTTAAGDSFNAGLAVALSQGKSIEESIDFANLVASISTTKFGAQSAMPTMKECNDFLEIHKNG